MRALALVSLCGILACRAAVSPTPEPPTTAVSDDAQRKVVAEAVDERLAIQAPDGRSIGATLVVPAGAGPHPAVLFIAGSGPTDRDWNSPLANGPARSAQMLADALAEHGIASLRYDKMGVGETPMVDQPNLDVYLGEGTATLAFLREHPRIDPKAVFVAGHSEGGLHATRLAVKAGDEVAGLILLATAAHSMKAVIADQLRAQFEASEVPAKEVEATMGRWNAAVDRVIAGETVDVATALEKPGLRRLLVSFQLPAQRELIRELLTFDPSAALAEVDQRVLMIGGGRDLQVDPAVELKALEQAARDAGLDATVVIAEHADHVLKHEPRDKAQLRADRGLATHYNAAGRTLDPEVVDAMVDWLGR